LLIDKYLEFVLSYILDIQACKKFKAYLNSKLKLYYFFLQLECNKRLQSNVRLQRKFSYILIMLKYQIKNGSIPRIEEFSQLEVRSSSDDEEIFISEGNGELLCY